MQDSVVIREMFKKIVVIELRETNLFRLGRSRHVNNIECLAKA